MAEVRRARMNALRGSVVAGEHETQHASSVLAGAHGGKAGNLISAVCRDGVHDFLRLPFLRHGQYVACRLRDDPAIQLAARAGRPSGLGDVVVQSCRVYHAVSPGGAKRPSAFDADILVLVCQSAHAFVPACPAPNDVPPNAETELRSFAVAARMQLPKRE